MQKLPKYHYPGDVGMDLYSMETIVVPPMGHAWIFHGIALEFPKGFAGIIKDKSSISKAGLHAMGGTFDAGYRGEYNTHLINLSNKPYTIEEGDKISQLVIFPVEIVELEEVDTLSETSRGQGAFGSTGRK